MLWGCVDGAAIVAVKDIPDTPDVSEDMPPQDMGAPSEDMPSQDMAQGSVCDGFECGEHGVCIVGNQGTPTCLCDPGYRMEAGECVLIPQGTGDPRECDERFGSCAPGTPGGGQGGGSGSVLLDGTDLGESYQFADDYDNDGVEDGSDNCPSVMDATQADTDGDGVGDVCDNCLNAANADQSNIDADGLGDACDPDLDGDNIPNAQDNCQMIPNPIFDGAAAQVDTDSDGLGDVCDEDMDGDGVLNFEDACPLNMDNTLTDDALCNQDTDGDHIADALDVCPLNFDPDQSNMDGDDLGDACDSDLDGDDVQNHVDNCSNISNEAQVDLDRDGLGDACDPNFCFVVFGDTKNCLDPSGDLKVYTFSRTVQTGAKVPLRLFLNRQNQAVRYFWRVVQAPSRSQYLLQNAQGTATISTPFEYHYLSDSVPSFVADLPGEYRIEVTVESIFEDRISRRVGETSEFMTTFTAHGPPVELSTSDDEGLAGCSVSGGHLDLSYGWMVLCGLLGLRRRREGVRLS